MSGPATGRHTGYRVLVTRPEPDAARTAKKLEVAGYQPLCLPVSETVATGLILPDVGYDAVAVTSANALRHAERAQLQPLLHLPLYAVGEKTASEARKAGFSNIYAGDGWGLHLGQYVANHFAAGREILYLTGKIRRPDFEAQLAAAGIRLHIAETYDTRTVVYSDAQLNEAIKHGTADVILLYSAVAARQLVALDRQMKGAFLGEAKYIFCLSQRIAAELPVCEAQIHISATPDEDALLHALTSNVL